MLWGMEWMFRKEAFPLTFYLNRRRNQPLELSSTGQTPTCQLLLIRVQKRELGVRKCLDQLTSRHLYETFSIKSSLKRLEFPSMPIINSTIIDMLTVHPACCGDTKKQRERNMQNSSLPGLKKKLS